MLGNVIYNSEKQDSPVLPGSKSTVCLWLNPEKVQEVSESIAFLDCFPR